MIRGVAGAVAYCYRSPREFELLVAMSGPVQQDCHVRAVSALTGDVGAGEVSAYRRSPKATGLVLAAFTERVSQFFVSRLSKG